jgi:hypothetical protein
MELKYRDEVENEIIDMLEKIGLSGIEFEYTQSGSDECTERGYITVFYEKEKVNW